MNIASDLLKQLRTWAFAGVIAAAASPTLLLSDAGTANAHPCLPAQGACPPANVVVTYNNWPGLPAPGVTVSISDYTPGGWQSCVYNAQPVKSDTLFTPLPYHSPSFELSAYSTHDVQIEAPALGTTWHTTVVCDTVTVYQGADVF